MKKGLIDIELHRHGTRLRLSALRRGLVSGFTLALIASSPEYSATAGESTVHSGSDGSVPLSEWIVVDGRFADWEGIDPVFQSEAPGSSMGTLEIENVWASSDQDRLYLRIKFSASTLLQGNSGVVLYVDTDGDTDTGTTVDGIGAELSWSFSDREGSVRVLDLPIRVIQSAVGLRQAPNMTASEFEVSLDRRSTLIGTPFLPHSPVSILFRVEEAESGTVMGSTGWLDLLLEDRPRPAIPEGPLDREDPAHLRVLTYNVFFDGLFERPDSFRRILQALDPDILSLQELYLHSVKQTRNWIAAALPEREWHAAGFGQGVILSRFPVHEWGGIGNERRGAWALLDTPKGRMAFINPHAPCCENDAGRQEEFDAIAAWIRDSRTVGRLGPRTPVIVAGDMNLVGDSRQLNTLLHGAIVDTTRHGPASPPDGDGSSLSDAMPYHLPATESYTWRNDRSVFAPGKLDYIVYTDSVLELGRSFVLWTPDLSARTLQQWGLQPEDTAIASDHLPVVADFRFRARDSSR